MNTMLVIAHPDDELLSFGPLLETSFEREEELHVVCLTFPSHERITQFFACANHYGFIPHCFGGPDSESKPGLFANKTVSALTHLMQKERIRCVYTHDLFSGDQGRHPQHVETAVMTGLAALNCPTPPVVNYLFYEGHASPDLLTVLTNPDYKNTVSSLNRFYEKDLRKELFHLLQKRSVDMRRYFTKK